MSAQGTTALQFEPPGPGSWNLDPVHFPRPVTRYWTEMHPEPFRRGTHEFMAYYGTLLESMEMQYVNGFAYNTMRPAPDDEIPQRFARAEEVWERKVWRDQLREWDETFKPAAIKTHRELQSVDADALSDDELVAYLTRCREHHSQMIFQHMRFTGSAMLPVGDLLAHLGVVDRRRAGRRARDDARRRAGVGGRVGRARTAHRRDHAATRLRARSSTADGDPGKTLAELRAFGGDVGTAMSDVSRPRRLSAARRLRHLRALRARAARRAAARDPIVRRRRGKATPTDVDARIAGIRVAGARRAPRASSTSCSARRVSCTACATNGASSATSGRRASCAAPRSRPVAGSRTRAASTTPSTSSTPASTRCAALVTGAGGPSADELAQRFADRSSRTAKEAPPSLGPPPPPPPDPSGLPPGVARVMHAVGIAMGELFGSSEAPHEENLLRGLAASGGVYEGPARRVAGPTEFDRIVQGDVLVTESTTEAFNILLPLLGAIVTDSGGLLSHSAIVAREYGIPGRGRDAQRDRAHPRRHARAGRRRRR